MVNCNYYLESAENCNCFIPFLSSLKNGHLFVCMCICMGAVFSSILFGSLWTHLDKNFILKTNKLVCVLNRTVREQSQQIWVSVIIRSDQKGAEAERGQIGLLFQWPLCQATANTERKKKKTSTHMPNLCLHVVPAHTAPSWLLIEKLLQHSQDRTYCELHTKQSDNRGGGVICQYILKVGTRTLQLPGMWETLFTGSCAQEVHNSDVFIVLDYRDFHF